MVPRRKRKFFDMSHWMHCGDCRFEINHLLSDMDQKSLRSKAQKLTLRRAPRTRMSKMATQVKANKNKITRMIVLKGKTKNRLEFEMASLNRGSLQNTYPGRITISRAAMRQSSIMAQASAITKPRSFSSWYCRSLSLSLKHSVSRLTCVDFS